MGQPLIDPPNSWREMPMAAFCSHQLEFALRYYPQLVRVRTYVHNHLDESLSLRDVAEKIGLSPSRLSHMFREKTGVGFRDWVRGERVCKAQKIIEATDMSVLALARAVGFRSSRSLERSFRAILRTTPREYKKRIRQRQ